MKDAPHSEHHSLSLGTKLALGGALLAAGVIAAPYMLPSLGATSGMAAEEALFLLHNETVGAGLAGVIGNAVSSIPLIGSALMQGGWLNIAATAATGLGGVLLGHWMSKNHEGKPGFDWGKMVKWASLATSALIALPSVLTGITNGIVFLASEYLSAETATNVLEQVSKTIGYTPYPDIFNSGLSGAAASLPHLLTCGSSIVPLMACFGAEAATDKPEKPHIHAHITTDVPAQTGKPCNATLTLTHANGKPLSAAELAVVHTEKLHLFVVDESLRDYHHIHPQPTGKAGEFAFSFTPNSPHQYSGWADITLAANDQNYKLKASIPSASRTRATPSIRTNQHAEAAGLQADWNSQPLHKDKDVMVHVTLRDQTGNPIHDLQPVMGAYAHLVGFSTDGNTLIHAHPLGIEPSTPQDRGGPELQFHLSPEVAGQVQFYLQLKRGGEDVFLPFGQLIQQQHDRSHAAKLTAPHCATPAMAR